MPDESGKQRQVPEAGPVEGPNAAALPVGTPPAAAAPAREIGGPKGPEPTRFGDWERAGRCIDF